MHPVIRESKDCIKGERMEFECSYKFVFSVHDIIWLRPLKLKKAMQMHVTLNTLNFCFFFSNSTLFVLLNAQTHIYKKPCSDFNDSYLVYSITKS